jgi:hypothetical protein
MNEGSMSELMQKMSQWGVTTPATVRGVADPLMTLSSTHSHPRPSQHGRRSIDSQFENRTRMSCSQVMGESCEGTCRFEEVDDDPMTMERDQDDEGSETWTEPHDGDAYSDMDLED